MRLLLNQIASLQAGYPFRGTIKEDLNGDIAVVQAKDITDLGKLITANLIQTTLTGKRRADTLKQGDVLFIAKGLRQFACHIKNDLSKVTCAPSLFLLRIKPDYKDRINPEFIAWQLNQPTTQNYFKKSAEGSMQISIRKAVLANTQLAIPDIDRQNTIAKLYAASIKEHALLTKMIDNRQQQLAALAHDLMAKHDAIEQHTQENPHAS